MAVSWIDSIRKTGHLSVFPGPTLSEDWLAVFDVALATFNTFSRSFACGVTLVRAAVPFNNCCPACANVQVDAWNGQRSITVNGKKFSHEVDGEGGRGITEKVIIDDHLHAAFIILPLRFGFRNLGRECGFLPRLAMLDHELTHAVGLNDEDHSTAENPDVFYDAPRLVVGEAATDDRLSLPDGRMMPPLVMNEETAQKIKSMW